MRKLFVIAVATMLFATWSCKDKVGEQVDLEELVDGNIEIVENPSGKAPLTAMAKIPTKENVRVEVTVEGDQPLQYEGSDYASNPDVPVIGLYPSASNTVTLKLTDLDENWAETTIQIDTDSLPDHLPEVTINGKQESQMAAGLTLCGFSYGQGSSFISNPMLIDNNGAVRWYLQLDHLGQISFPIRAKDDGKIWLANGDEVKEVDWLGQELRTVHIPGYIQHHEIQEMPNGNLLLAVNKKGLGTVEDHIIEVDPSGNVVEEWDLRQILDVDRTALVNDTVDWFHMNAVYYDENDDALIVSGRNQGVVKIDRDNNLKWILAPHKGWGKAGVDGNGHETSDFLLTATDASGNPYDSDVQNGDQAHADFDWSWGQHAPMILPNGNLFIYDNGFNRQFDQASSYSRAVEYSVDESNMTVSQEWQYGKSRGTDLQSTIISDVDLLENDNRLMTSGIIFSNNDHRGKVVEVQYPSKNEVFEMTLHYKNAFSSGNMAWGDFDLMYRAERIDFSDMPVYPF